MRQTEISKVERLEDHKVSEIEIAPSLYRSPTTDGLATQDKGAISEINLPIFGARGN